MAAELVGGAVLQAVFAVLFERLTPQNAEFLNFIRRKKLDNNLLHRLKPSLNAARSVLNDAELKQFKDSAVRDWLDDLRDVVYQVEDFMDDVSTIIDTQNQVCNFSSVSLTVRDTDMANKLEAIAAKIEFIVAQKDLLGLKTSVEPKNLSQRTQSTSRVKVSDVCGREKEKDAIIKLMSDNNDNLSVIPIVGLGGIGKTTLAQLVYNGDYVKQNFDLKAWVCVSEAFDLSRITQTIIKSVDPNHAFDIMDLNLLQLNLEEKLSKKKFLVVLDDVWNEKYTDWDTLMIPFHEGSEGSKIIVTTRNEKVASMVKTIPTFYRLGLLSDEECLSLFASHALRSSDPSLSSWVENFGRDIVSKCKGLPLAAKALGGLFRSKPDIQHWSNILKNDIWDSVEDDMVPALRVSYDYLPPHLKRCFVYCSLFPKDYKFVKKDLILMWMAEGFLQPSNRVMMTSEEVGYDYFDDLTSRSFFQPSSEDNGYFVMHDLIHDLTISVARDFFFRLEEEGRRNKISSRARHLSYINLNFPSIDDIESFKGAKGLRTIIGFDSKWLPSSIGNMIMLLDLKYLRVLSFKDCEALKAIPASICEFIYLRYLDLSKTGISVLPDSLCKVYNLQTLKLNSCHNLKMLPNDIHDLVNLRYLEFEWTPLEKLPRGIGKLKNLQILSNFIVGEEPGTSIDELGEVQNLTDHLGISKLENIKSGNEVWGARMMEKKRIKGLTLVWSHESEDCINDSQTENDILNHLQPYWGLEGLVIGGYRGTMFPNWLSYRSYDKLTSLCLRSCKNCWMLPPLGQLPTLKKLEISEFEKVVNIGVEFFKGDDCALMTPFASLEDLDFSFMSAWEKWQSSFEMEAFPKLQKLRIHGCPKLTGDLPCQLVSLKDLIIIGCPLLASIPRCPELERLRTWTSPKIVLQEKGLPPSLQSLAISGDYMLQSMFEAMAHSEIRNLQELDIHDCSDSTSVRIDYIPESVKWLRIENCKRVEFPKQQCHMQLEALSITSCDTLTSLPLECFTILKNLFIEGCENLVSVLVSNSTPLGNLERLTIVDCKNLSRLSDNSECLFPNLKSLSLSRCQEVQPFPKGFLPSSLTSLRISNCEKLLASHSEWHLPCITTLQITGNSPTFPISSDEDIKCFPEGCSLPPTLNSLGLYYLSSLETLNCKGLHHLTSLQKLAIEHCPKLDKFAGEMLPSSLRKLIFYGSSLIEEHCRNKDQNIWPKISHIPAIRLSWEWISYNTTSQRYQIS